MPEAPSRLRGFLAELKSRRVYRVAATYVVVAFLVIQAADLLFPRLLLPDWSVTLVIGIALVGFPIALVLGWAFEVTPEGVRRTERAAGEKTSEGPEHAQEVARVPGPEPASERRTAALGGAGAAPGEEEDRDHRAIHAALEGVGVLALVALAVAGSWYLLNDRGTTDPAGPAGERGGDFVIPSAPGDAGADGAPSEQRRGMLEIATDPEGAAVTLTRVAPPGDFPDRPPAAHDETPFRLTLAPGEYHVRLALPRTTPLDLLVRVRAGDTVRLERSLVPSGGLADGMVQVPAGPSPMSDRRLDAFLMDRTEVTNEAFLEFVSEGGYDDPSLWPDTLVLSGVRLPWDEARERLVDRTGIPGPRRWSGGLYPEGRKDHPVVGVTWYEAEAFARWAGKELPTRDQWWRAAHGDRERRFPWGEDDDTADRRANFGLEGTAPVGTHPLGASPYGLLDMVGNVREWVRRDSDGAYLAAGGSWQDPLYMSEPGHAEIFPPGYASDAIGFRCVKFVRGGR